MSNLSNSRASEDLNRIEADVIQALQNDSSNFEGLGSLINKFNVLKELRSDAWDVYVAADAAYALVEDDSLSDEYVTARAACNKAHIAYLIVCDAYKAELKAVS